MSRLSRVLLIALSAVVSLTLVSPLASAVPDRKLGATLGSVWETVLEIPLPQNPYNGGDPCINLKSIVAPLAPVGAPDITCTVRPGTRVFVTAESAECSTVEAAPYFGEDEASLRECARKADEGFATPTVSVDGKPVAVTEVETELLTLDLPADNVFGVPAQTAYSVAHGWVALLPPLRPGPHVVTIHNVGKDAYGNDIDATNSTTILVQPLNR